MAQWSDGYISDINYTYGYYGELNPLQTVPTLLMAGLAPPRFQTACELGFGQGVSINIHAAASAIQWHGTDFNPAQTSFAKSLADAAHSQAALFDQSFAEFCQRTDLPEFDFIGLHGIWSWISLENRQCIVDFIRRKLKVGGLLYVSYNTLPGWSAAAPLRHLLAEHAHVMGAPGQGMLPRVHASVEFSKKLIDLSHTYREQVPSVTQRLEQIAGQNAHYLAHEYFNRDWHPMYFADMAQALAPAKVTYACSANFLDDFKLASLTAEQRGFLDGITDPMFAQTVKDFLLNKQFRRDFWIKGARTIGTFEQSQYWRALHFVLARPRGDIALKLTGAAGSVDLLPHIYDPLLDLLADGQIHAFPEIEEIAQKHQIAQNLLFEALAILQAKGDVVVAQEEQAIQASKPCTERLNAHLMHMSMVSGDVPYLASPVSGGAFSLGRIDQLFLQAHAQGLRQPQQWAAHAWQVLAQQGQSLIRDGKPFSGEAENMQELLRLAQQFEQKALPALVFLQMAAAD